MTFDPMEEKLEAEAREDRKQEEIEAKHYDWPWIIPTDIARDGECK